MTHLPTALHPTTNPLGLSTAARPAPDLAGLFALQAATADVTTRAVVHAMLAACSVASTTGTHHCYRDLAGLS